MATTNAEIGNGTQLSQLFAELSRLVHARPGFDAVARVLVDAAPRLIAGCDHASLMVRSAGQYRTVAASDDIARQVDQLERETGEGPCVDVIDSDAYELDADIATHSQWPGLARRVLAETPVRGMAGYRLLVDGTKAGALNVFSDTAGAMTQESADTGILLASFATVALGGSADHEQATTLRDGLESNREIGTAIGLLMAAHQITREEAFETLRRASSQLNRKLATIARELVERGPDPTPSAPRR